MLLCCNTCAALSFKMCRAIAANGVALDVLMHCCCGAVAVAAVLLHCCCDAVAMDAVLMHCCCGAVAVAAALPLLSAHWCLDSGMDFCQSSFYKWKLAWYHHTVLCLFHVLIYTIIWTKQIRK